MKKKILALCLCTAMATIAVVGGTLAYFTDADKAVNEFTLGNISIDLQETFDPENAELMPGKDVNKDVVIKNDGDNDAWVWYEWYIPTELDSTDGSTGTHNVLHVNSLGRTWDKYREDQKYWESGQTQAVVENQTWDHDPEGELELEVGPQGYFEPVEIDGIEYNKYVVLYHGKLAAGESTTQAMDKVYLDSKVDATVDKDGNVSYWIVEGGKMTPINFDLSKVNIIVKAYGIQAEGFENVYDAYKAYQEQVTP